MVARHLVTVLGFAAGLLAGAGCDPAPETITRSEFALEFDETYCDWYVDCGMGCPKNGFGGAQQDDCEFHPEKAVECLETLHELYDDRSCGQSPAYIGEVCLSEVFTDCDPNDEQD